MKDSRVTDIPVFDKEAGEILSYSEINYKAIEV